MPSVGMTRHELAVLALLSSEQDIHDDLRETLGLPSLNGPDDPAAPLGIESLMARGLLRKDGDRVTLDPRVAAAGAAIGGATRWVKLYLATEQAASASVLVEDGTFRVALDGIAPGVWSVGLVDDVVSLTGVVSSSVAAFIGDEPGSRVAIGWRDASGVGDVDVFLGDEGDDVGWRAVTRTGTTMGTTALEALGETVAALVSA